MVAPEPLIPLFVPPPIVAAPIPASGSDVSLGSAEVDGPGTGSGGVGTGTGSGGAGTGSGGADASVPPVRTRRIRGHFTNRDYPDEAERAGAQGVVAARVTVGADGRVSGCWVRVSSGVAALDAVTCRVIRKRFRFSPARDARGAAVPDVIEWEQSWSLRPEDRPEYAEAECRARADRIAAAPERRAAFLACMASFGWQR